MNADIPRRLENVIRLGRIASVTTSQPFHTVTVNLGDIVTHQLRLLNLRAGTDKTHDLPSVGEECVVLSPCGELALGIVVCGLNNNDNPTPSQDANIKLRVFEDGAVISYDTKNHQLQAILPAAATAILTAKGGLTINGDTTINGNLNISGDQAVGGKSHSNGNISCDGDVSAGNISLKGHKHNGVKGGTDTSGGAI